MGKSLATAASAEILVAVAAVESKPACPPPTHVEALSNKMTTRLVTDPTLQDHENSRGK
jgi:hypothetical protein